MKVRLMLCLVIAVFMLGCAAEQPVVPETGQASEPDDAGIASDAQAAEPVSAQPDFIEISELESEIQDKFFYKKGFQEIDYTFSNDKSSDPSIKVRTSTKNRFKILSFDSGISSSAEFEAFVKNRYDLLVAEKDAAAKSKVESANAASSKIEEYSYEYSHKMEEMQSEPKAFIEKHSLVHIRTIKKHLEDDLVYADSSEFRINAVVFCSPKLIVEVYPFEEIDFTYGGAYSDFKSNLDRGLEDQEKEIIASAKKLSEICSAS